MDSSNAKSYDSVDYQATNHTVHILNYCACIALLEALKGGFITTYIREYGSTLLCREKNGRPSISIANDDLKSLVNWYYIQIGFNTHIPIHI